MRIGMISTRLAGTDGVSLETRKVATILERAGHTVYYCAGELDPDLHGMLIPEMHFTHPEAKWIHDRAFGSDQPVPGLAERITSLAAYLQDAVARFDRAFELDVLMTENALTIPMNVPLGLALTDYIAATAKPTLAHHHDFYWERERFRTNNIPELLKKAFPPALPSVCHIVINTPAQQSLAAQRGVESTVLPNIFDFAHAAPGITAFSLDLRDGLGLTDDHLLILQPTRVIRRKGIELAIELVGRLREPANVQRLLGKEPVLVITHHAGDEGTEYLDELQQQAGEAGVPLLYAPARFAPQAAMVNQQKVYSLWDAYVQADFVTYPSLYEGFGNALLETVYFRLPMLVNRYSVYAADIGPLGFDFIEIDGRVTDAAVEAVIEAIVDPVRRRRMVEFNYQLANDHFSYEAVGATLEGLLQRCAGG